MARKSKNNKEYQKLNKYFMIAKVFLLATPLICYFYILLQSSILGSSFQEILVQNPQVTIIFLIAMINPYIAYIVKLIQKHLEQKDYQFSCLNMAILLVAQILTFNVFYFFMLLYVFIRAIRYYDIQLLNNLRKITIKQTLFNGGGSLFVLLISGISLFSTIKLM